MGIPLILPTWLLGVNEPCIQALPTPLWPPGMAPQYVYASFAGPKLCFDCIGWFPQSAHPPNPIRMEQQPPFNTAKYTGTQDGYTCQWQGCAPCYLKLATTAGPVLFFGQAIPGATFFVNMWDCDDPMMCGYGGSGVVSWCPGAHTLMLDYNLNYTEGIMWDFWPGDFKKIIYRFAEPKTPMNLLVEWQIPK